MLLAQSLTVVEIIVVVAYLMVVGYLGWLGYSRTKTATDCLVVGRGVHPFVMALSYGAMFISTSAIVGFGGVAGLFGMSLLWLTFLNIFVGIFIAFVFLGGLVFEGVTRAAAKASMVTGFVVTAVWLLFVKDKEARALGICHAIFGKHSLFVTEKALPTSGNWYGVAPLIVALPLSLLVLIIVSMAPKAPDDAHLSKCFGSKT